MQRRFSFALSAALCLWMLALATHFHVNDNDEGSHQGTHSLCAFCASVPSTGAAPTVAVLIAPPQLRSFSAPADIALPATATAITGYYSRGPPLV